MLLLLCKIQQEFTWWRKLLNVGILPILDKPRYKVSSKTAGNYKNDQMLLHNLLGMGSSLWTPPDLLVQTHMMYRSPQSKCS